MVPRHEPLLAIGAAHRYVVSGIDSDAIIRERGRQQPSVQKHECDYGHVLGRWATDSRDGSLPDVCQTELHPWCSPLRSRIREVCLFNSSTLIMRIETVLALESLEYRPQHFIVARGRVGSPPIPSREARFLSRKVLLYEWQETA